MNHLKTIAILNSSLLILLIFPYFSLPQTLEKYDFGLADSEDEQHLSLAYNPLHCHPVVIQPFPWSSV